MSNTIHGIVCISLKKIRCPYNVGLALVILLVQRTVPLRTPQSQNLHQLLNTATDKLTWKQWITRVQLSQYAAKRPHVYRHGVHHSQNHLGGPVEPALYVSVHPLMLVAA